MAIATFCTIGRIVVRLRIFRKLAVDDIFVLLAWASSAAFATEWHIKSPGLYRTLDFQNSGRALDASYFVELHEFITAQTSALICQGVGLWCIKLSFLFFFRTIGVNIRKQKIIWWLVAIFVVAMFPFYIAFIPWKCHNVSDIVKTASKCSQTYLLRTKILTTAADCNTAEVAKKTRDGLRVITVADILTDAASKFE